jgi:hypothetical protein
MSASTLKRTPGPRKKLSEYTTQVCCCIQPVSRHPIGIYENYKASSIKWINRKILTLCTGIYLKKTLLQFIGTFQCVVFIPGTKCIKKITMC